MAYCVSQPDLDLDRAAVLELWSRNLPEASADRYTWLYQAGPASGWLLRTEDGAVVGSAGLMDRTLSAWGSTLRAATAIDLNVDRDHRTMGPALGLGRAVAATLRDRRHDLIYALPVAQSETIFRRIGYRQVGKLGRWIKPLRCRDSLARWLRHGLARKAAAAVIDPLLRLTSAETCYCRPRGIRIELAERFDRRFDALWQTAAGRLPIIGQRTADYLDWRFCRCGGAGHRVLSVVGPDDELLAYLVYHNRQGIAQIADFLFADLPHLDVLLAELLRILRRENARAVAIAYLGPEAVGRRFRRLGFWRRPSGRNVLVCVDPQRFGPELPRLLSAENWHLTLADTDTDS